MHTILCVSLESLNIKFNIKMIYIQFLFQLSYYIKDINMALSKLSDNLNEVETYIHWNSAQR
jgi:hypothetical protein